MTSVVSPSMPWGAKWPLWFPLLCQGVLSGLLASTIRCLKQSCDAGFSGFTVHLGARTTHVKATAALGGKIVGVSILCVYSCLGWEFLNCVPL